MAKRGTFSTKIKAWTTGTWTSEKCDVSRLAFPSSGDNVWGFIKWFEENTEDESKAKVKVDILDGDDNVLRSDLSGSTVIGNNRFNKSLDLNSFNNVRQVDIRIRFKLFSLDKLPMVSNIELGSRNTW